MDEYGCSLKFKCNGRRILLVGQDSVISRVKASVLRCVFCETVDFVTMR